MAQVYFFLGYDIANDRVVTSKRPATLEAIKRFNGAPIMNRGHDVPDDQLDAYGFFTGQLLPEKK